MVEKCEKCLHKNVCGVKSSFELVIEDLVTMENNNPIFKLTADCSEFSHSRAKQTRKKEVEENA